MFVTVFTFQAKVGHEAQITAHFADWQATIRPGKTGFVSSDLLQSITDPRTFTAIARFTDQAASSAIANLPEQDAWYRALVALSEREPVFMDYSVAHHAV